jgi:hypothetical protein
MLNRIYQANQLKELAVFKEESKRLGIQQGDRLHKIESQLSTLLNRKDATVNRDSALLELSDLEKAMSRLGIAQRDISNGIEILRSLGFPSRTVRHTAIPNAHQETFDWAFKCDISPGAAGGRCSPRASTSNLLNWLQKGTGTFWVSGKPGSGKSTFMKFIASHPETTNALVAWAQPLPVTIASHYFWSQGTHMQKSQAGLIQSLLYEIFRNCPDLAQQICPARWGSDKGQPPWTMSELRSAMRAVSAYQKIARKFCFFIDGLDEYQGDHIDFCEDLRALFESPNIKLCVSSRPWNVFEDTFGENSRQKLYIHELTKNDMLKYTRHRLQQHRRWKALAARSDMTEFLIRSIVDKAKGVFLWVFIVTKLLREGLTNHDSFSDLRRRLESFPSDLEPFFKQMIQSVEPFYRHKMAESLQIALAAKEPLDALVYSFYDGEEDFSFNGSSYSYDIDDMELQNRRETVIRRLNGWCRCLLEANFLGQIDFLHRTVADYLRTREISELLDSNVTENFSPNLAICDAQIAWLAGVGFGDDPFGQDSTARKALIYASSAELENHVAKSRIDASIEKLENSIDGSVVSCNITNTANSVLTTLVIRFWTLFWPYH